MKASMLLDGDPPKVTPKELRSVLERAGLQVGSRGADLGVVVGGDGRFSRYGRTQTIPLLFVGVRSKSPTGSKAFLAEVMFDELPEALGRIVAGEYEVVEHKRLQVFMNGTPLGEVFTDAYLERGAESTCLRYNLKVRGEESFNEAAVSDGVVISTSAGATGYYSYLDRIKKGFVEPDAFARIGKDEVGVCHINPTYTERSSSEKHPLRYTLPWGTKVELELFRRADARVYGVGEARKGIRVTLGDRLTISPGKSVTRVVSTGRVSR
jgi:hypothetical protein